MRRVVYRKDGLDPRYPWSYQIFEIDQSYWLSTGYKTKAAAMRDYDRNHRKRRSGLNPTR